MHGPGLASTPGQFFANRIPRENFPDVNWNIQPGVEARARPCMHKLSCVEQLTYSCVHAQRLYTLCSLFEYEHVE